MKHLFRYFLAGFALLLTVTVGATTRQDTLYINSGHIYSVDSVVLPVWCLNTSALFNAAPGVVLARAGDRLELTLVNHQPEAHQLSFSGSAISQVLNVRGGEDTTIVLQASDIELVRIIDTNAQQRYAGLSAMLVFTGKEKVDHRFFWNLREYQVGLTEDLSLLNEDYAPQYFTINNRSFPSTLNDTLGYLSGTIGDTILLYVYNTGIMNHNLHFHGYHAEIMFSALNTHMVGRIKDSFPIDVNEAIIFRIVPHQAGIFPIHNHNLGATLGNNIYPNGMVSQIKISHP